MASTDRSPHHQAFIDELRAAGAAPIGLRHELRAVTQHAIAASDARSPSAFPVALAGGLVALGLAAYLTAPSPHATLRSESTVASLFVLAHLLGVVGLILTLLRSPRSVHRRWFVTLTLAPTLVGSLGSALFPRQRFEGLAVIANATTRTGDALAVIGCAALLVGCLERGGRPRLFAAGWRFFAAGCLISALGQIPWAVEFAVHDDSHWLAGSLFTGGGLVLLSIAMLRYVPVVRSDAEPSEPNEPQPSPRGTTVRRTLSEVR